jgi:5-methylthioadenosine/S-adenosylhomocysteine deaminase
MAASSAKRNFWITGATLVTQNEKRQAVRANLRIEGGRIAEITRRAPKKLLPRAGDVDATGLTLLPGFVQGHVHLCQTLFRNQADDMELMDWLQKRIWVFEAAHTAETLHTSALLGIHELLSGGTTTVLDMGTVRHTDAIFEAVQSTGIRASVGKCLMDHPKTTPRTLRESTLQALKEAEELYLRWNGRENDRIRVSYAPRFVVSCTEKLLLQVRDRAHERGALIHTHASENLKEIRLVKDLVGCENVEYLHQLGLTSPHLVLAHCIWLKPHEKDLLRQSQTKVVHCPSSNLKLASGLAHVPDLRARGITVALGADGAPCNNNLNMWTEMRLAALLHKPGNGPKTLRAQEALDMATREGAKALSWSDSIGSIEVGKRADLIAVDLQTPENALFSAGKEPHPESLASQLVYSTQRHHVRQTWVDGRSVYQNGQVTGLPAGPLLERVFRAQKQIRKSARLGVDNP